MITFLVLQEIEKAKEMEGVPDEEGWITVTKHGKNKATPFTEARKKHLTYKERKKRKEKVLLDFFLTAKGATLIFISGHGSAISSAKQGKSGSIYNLVKN